jgi:hypothetical protein
VGTALVLAVVLGVGKIPIPETATQFPDCTAFAGAGLNREANMLAAALADSGRALRGGGPGPQQLAARWRAGGLNDAEKVVTLLGGGEYHDRALFPAYEDALRSGDLRIRQAAAVGFFRLVGAMPPLPSQIPDTPQTWRHLDRMMRDLGWVLRTRSLVSVWVDSYVAGKGVLRPELFAFRQPASDCLAAIRRIARPDDLPEVLSLWPLLESEGERAQILATIEAITLQRLINRSLGPRQPSGEWQLKAGLATIDQWVTNLCGTIDGERQLRLSLERSGLLDAGGDVTARTWFALVTSRFPPFAPLAAERLMDLSGTAVTLDWLNFDDPLNLEACRRLREQLPVSSWFPPAKAKKR